MVRVEITDGSFGNLITNLPYHEFDMDDFKELYHLRWFQENAYRDIKYLLCLRKLHSKKCEYIVQEIWARAILHNFCAEITSGVKIEKCGKKYEYQANYSEAIQYIFNIHLSAGRFNHFKQKRWIGFIVMPF